MSIAEIQQQLNAHREKEAHLREEWQALRARALSEVRELARAFGFTASELPLPGRGPVIRKHGEPKYREPNGTRTWTGQGKRPKWFSKALEEGLPKEAMLIGRPDAK